MWSKMPQSCHKKEVLAQKPQVSSHLAYPTSPVLE